MSKRSKNILGSKQPKPVGSEPVPVVHDPNPPVKKTLAELQKEYNNVFLIVCPYCRGSGKTYMWDCTACKTHGIVDSRTFKYPEPQSNPAKKKVN